MMRKIKGLLLVLCMVLCMAALTECSSEKKLADHVTTLSADDVANYKTQASQTLQTLVSFTDDIIEQIQAQATDDFSISAVESWKSVKAELGGFQEITEQAVEEKGSQITITSRAVFEKATADVQMVVDQPTQMAVSMGFNVNYSMAETMKMAGMNTLMGIGIVFCMLVFLSFLISQFKHISRLEEKFTKKQEKPSEVAVKTEVPVVAAEEEELVDDGELVAVIAAAIAAAENTSTDGFVVRSIKKSNAAKWRRA